jgi:hypothetical protein
LSDNGNNTNQYKVTLEIDLFKSHSSLYEYAVIFSFVNSATGRFLTLFFAACFLGMQLCQIHHVEPVKQNSNTFYAVESSALACSLTDIQSLVYPKQYADAELKLVSQKAQLSKQKQYQERIAKQVQQPFVYPQQQNLDAELFALSQVVSFIVQQQLQLFIQLNPRITQRLFKPEPIEYLSFL